MFNVAGYLIEEKRRWPIITASPEDNVLNQFRIWKDRHVQMRETRTSHRMKNSSYYVLPRSGIELTTPLGHGGGI